MAVIDKPIARLVDAVLSVSGELELAPVLRHVVEAACALVDARYAALGVVGPDGRLEEFVHTGMDPVTVGRLGALPSGHGLLGLLIRDPRPLRLRNIADHEASSGFPPGHPWMSSFLGVPIRVGDQVFGNLYLAEKQSPEGFSANDEELAVALAAVAGAAIHNARLYDRTHHRERWLDAVRQITTALLRGDGPDEVLTAVVARAGELVGADVAAMVVPAGDERLVVRAVEGHQADRLHGTVFPRNGSVSGAVMDTAQAALVDDIASDPRSSQPMVRLADFGPALFVPLNGSDGPLGTLAVANRLGGRRFTDADREMVESMAVQSGLAIEYGRAQQQIQRFALVEERDRIGTDLRESVIQRVFAAGLALEHLAMRVAQPDPDLSQRLQGVVDELDDAIRDLRGAVYGLHSPTGSGDITP